MSDTTKKRRGTGNRKAKAADDAAEQARRDREALSWELHCSGVPYREIAKRTGVSLGCVANDINNRRRVDPDREARIAAANARLEPVMDVMRDQALEGDTQAANALAKLQSTHADINGYKAPEKRELSGPNGGPIDVAASPARAREIFSQVFGDKVAETLPDAGQAVRGEAE